MFRKIAGFEFRYQIGSPVFWTTAVVFGLMAFGATTSDNIRIGSGGNTNINAPFAIIESMMILSIFAVFIMTAFVANVVIRDDETGFAPLIRTTRVGKFDYLFGRFTGALAAGFIAFATVPIAFAAGALMPWLDPEKMGPFTPAHYAYAYLVFCVPTLFITGAYCFALATMTRSMIATYVGVITLLVLYFIAGNYFDKPEYDHIVGLADPFGISAFTVVTKYWTASDRNTRLPEIAGLVLQNRVIWMGVAVLLLGGAWLSFTRRAESRRTKPSRRERAAAAALAAQGAEIGSAAAAGAGAGGAGTGAGAGAGASAPPAGGSPFAALYALARFDMAAVFRSPAFFVLLGIGFLNALGGLWSANELYGDVIYPVTRVMIQTLGPSFSIIPLIVAIYYAGELVWRDRERRVNEIADATPAPDWAFALPKILGLVLVLLATVAISTVAALIVQTLKGFPHYEIGKYIDWYVIPQSIDVAMFAVLAIFLQTLVPHKFVGWLLMLLVVIAQLTLGKLGFEHSLYQFGRGPPVPLSDMNGAGKFADYRAWFRLYWIAICAILCVLTYAFWRRGTAPRLMPRLKRLPGRLRGVAGGIAAVAAVAALAVGAWIYTNTNVINPYRTQLDEERLLADYEKALLPYRSVEQPRIRDVQLRVDLEPHAPRAVIHGRFMLENASAAPIDHLHVRWDRWLQMRELTVPGGSIQTEYPRFHYRIYKLAEALAPGAKLAVDFTTVREQRGFRNRDNEHRIVDNGTFLDSNEIEPLIGMDREGLLTDRAKRRKYGLPEDLRPPKLDENGPREHEALRADSDWVNADITVSTVADQIPIAPGYKVSENVEGGRRTVRYKTEAPIMHDFSIQSAAYAVRLDRWKNVNLSIYYDPQHPYNVERMRRAMHASLDYYTREFSPYQFKQVRILEFPDYAQFAQSFANTIPYSEGIGFIENYDDPEKIDMVTYVTAHEIGHQWWGHQVVSADMQGATFLIETLAQYSALMVMEHLYGPEHIRKFLKFELDRYLRRRGGEAVEELPLERVENQQYIHYNKGSLVMYLLKDTIGEGAVNRALRSLLQQYAFKSAPYPTSLDLVKRLRAEAGPEHQQLLTDLFEKITTYDIKTLSAKSMRQSDGQWDTALEVEAHKFYADGKGRETEAPLSEAFDVGLFSVNPQDKSFVRASVLSFGQRTFRSGRQTLHVRSSAQPKFAGVDPYIKHIDRNADDNVVSAE